METKEQMLIVSGLAVAFLLFNIVQIFTFSVWMHFLFQIYIFWLAVSPFYNGKKGSPIIYTVIRLTLGLT